MNLPALILACANGVSPVTTAAIIQVESAGAPLAIATNPYRSLPAVKDIEQAAALVDGLLKQGVNVDIGLMQINSQHLPKLGLTPKALLDPCTNIYIGTTILHQAYARRSKRESSSQNALRSALSIYNTGSPTNGKRNGYVDKVLSAAGLTDTTKRRNLAAKASRSSSRIRFQRKDTPNAISSNFLSLPTTSSNRIRPNRFVRSRSDIGD